MKLLLCCSLALLLTALPIGAAKSGGKEAKVTHIIRDVKLLPEQADARAAALNDQVDEDTGVRTGDSSRSELTFPDLTITRLGANSIFSFDKAGRTVDLGGGSVLLRVPKGSGGANIRAPSVAVAVTGTTLILEAARGARSRMIVLEGGARLSLTRNASQSRIVQAGQMLDVPAGATTLPEPVNVDLNQVMKSHPLITGFPPLPSRDLIAAAAARQREQPVYPGRPAGGGPIVGVGGVNIPPFFGGGTGGGGGGTGAGGGGGRTPTNPTNPGGAANPTGPTGPGTVGTKPTTPTGPGTVGTKPTGPAGPRTAGAVSGISRTPVRTTAKPTPPPIR